MPSSCRKAGVKEHTYYTWRKRFGGMNVSSLLELKTLTKENERLKKIVAELELGEFDS